MTKKIKTLFIIFMITLGVFSTKALAASFGISSSKSTLNIGDTATVTIKADDCLGQFTISSSDSSIVSVSDTSKWLENNSATITITAKKAGKATITLTATDVSDTSGEKEITGSKPITITVSEPKKEEQKAEETKTETPKESTNSENSDDKKTTTVTKSSDASLKSITIGGKKYNNPGTTTTAESVSAETSSIKIEAQTNDSKAKVTGTGTKELVTGTNKFTLKVTAENGSTKSYTIKVTKLAEEVTTPNIVEEIQEEPTQELELRLSSLTIDDVELIPLFEPEIFSYSVYITNLTELKINATANKENTNIEILGNTNLIEGENTATVKLSKDEVTVEYKIIIHKAGLSSVQKNEENKIEKNQNEKIGFIGQVKDWWNKSGPISITFISILTLMCIAIGFAITTYKYSKPIREKSKHFDEN